MFPVTYNVNSTNTCTRVCSYALPYSTAERDPGNEQHQAGRYVSIVFLPDIDEHYCESLVQWFCWF